MSWLISSTVGISQKLMSGNSSESSFAYSVLMEPSFFPSSNNSNHKGVNIRLFSSTAAAKICGSFKIGIACIFSWLRSASD